ncbi:MAG: VOC family protein [Puniceicoccaceae bacterium]
MNKIDHLIFAVPDLEMGRDIFEERFGVRAILGGEHPDYGTHNAQLSLGPQMYLEIIAPLPGIDISGREMLFGPNGFEQPRLVTWVLRCESIESTVESATLVGVRLGAIQPGKRVKPDGTVVSWTLTDPYAMPLNGAVPFLINWGNTPHPAPQAPGIGQFSGMRIQHPQPEQVRKALTALGTEVEVEEAETFQLIATIKTAGGEVEIR